MTNPDLAMFATGMIDQLQRYGAARHRPIDRSGDVIEVEAREWDRILGAVVKARDAAAEGARDAGDAEAPIARGGGC